MNLYIHIEHVHGFNPLVGLVFVNLGEKKEEENV